MVVVGAIHRIGWEIRSGHAPREPSLSSAVSLLKDVSVSLLITHQTCDQYVTYCLVIVQSLSRVLLCQPMNCSTPGFPVLHYFPEFVQAHVHWVSDAIQPFHPLLSPSFLALNLSQHQGFFQWVHSSHQVAKVLELQIQHQSFQWIFRTDFL